LGFKGGKNPYVHHPLKGIIKEFSPGLRIMAPIPQGTLFGNGNKEKGFQVFPRKVELKLRKLNFQPMFGNNN